MIKDKEWLKEEVNRRRKLACRFSDLTSVVSSKEIKDLIDQLDEPEKVVVKPFIAEWFEKHKNDLELNTFILVASIYDEEISCSKKMKKFINNTENKPFETLFRMKDGYTIEPQKTYRFTLNAFHEIDVNATSLEEAQKEAVKTWNQYFVRNRDFGEAEFEGEVDEEGEVTE